MSNIDILTSNDHMQKCIVSCLSCFQACEECIIACYQEPDMNARIKCVTILRDCADMCVLAAKLMSRNSPHSKQICTICADMCKMCAKDCEAFKDEHCKRCAEVCSACAEECRQMTQM